MIEVLSMSRGIAGLVMCSILLISSLIVISEDGNSTSRGEYGGYFGSQRIYNSTRSLSGGMGAADLDADGVVEIVFCDFSGNVIMMEPRDDGSYRALPIWEQEGPQGTDTGLFDLVISDVLVEYAGPEIVVAGYSGNVFVLYKDGNIWKDQVIYTMPDDAFGDPFRIFDIEIADMDPAPGDEILLGSMVNNQENPEKNIYPDNYLRYLYRGETDWEVVEIELPQSVKAIDVGDADPSLEGVEVYVTTSGWEGASTPSYLYQLYKNGNEWDHRLLFTNPNNLIANVRVGEIWSGHDGNELIIAGLSGWCRVLWEEDGEFLRKDIFQAKTTSGENSALEGLAIGDFNPLHDGDEAMVTGYYNEVTQIMEVDGEIVADLAWVTDAPDFKLEFSGVEVFDVTDRYDGNEVLVANLQGWIEILYFQEDGLEMILPDVPIMVDADSSTQFDIELVPEGGVSGEVKIEITGGNGVDIIFDSVLTLERGTTLRIPVIIDPTTTGERTMELTINASVSGYDLTGTVDVDVTPVGGGFTVQVNPSTITMYDTAGNTMQSQVSLVGAEGYDIIELRAEDVTGMTVMVDSPIAPDGVSNLIVQVDQGFIGSRSITITGYHNSIPISQAILFVNVLELSNALELEMRQDAEDNYYINAHLNASAELRSLTFTAYLENEVLYRQTMNLPGNGQVDLPILPLNEGDKGEIWIKVTNVGNLDVMNETLGEVDIPKEEDDDLDATSILIGILFIVGAIVIVALMYIFMRPKDGKPEDDASIEGIGGRRKYDYTVKEDRVRGGRIPSRERRESLPPRGRESSDRRSPPSKRRDPSGGRPPRSRRR